MAKDIQHSFSFIGIKIVVVKRIFYYCLDIEVPPIKTFDYNCFDMRSILEMALKRKLWDLVEWILANIDAKMFDIKLVILTKEMLSNVHALVIMDLRSNSLWSKCSNNQLNLLPFEYFVTLLFSFQ
jgi:hypothetical protein